MGDKQYTVGDVAFYYNNAKQTIRNYANYGLVTYNASLADDQQTIDVYIEDNMGQVVQKSFTFQNDSDTGGEEQ